MAKFDGFHTKLNWATNIIFGLYCDNVFYKSVNYIILLAKWYIYNQVYLDQKVEFLNFLVTQSSWNFTCYTHKVSRHIRFCEYSISTEFEHIFQF